MREREIIARLEARLGPIHARQRLGIESDHEARVFGGGFSFFHLENWYSAPSLIRASLKLTGLYARAVRNAHDVSVAENPLSLPGLPASMAGLRILHLSDLHLDMSPEIVHAIVSRVRQVQCDLCVLTGDYRFRTYGPIEEVIRAMAELRSSLAGPVYAVLGNHDSVTMLPELEEMDIRVLMNESVEIERGGTQIHLAGIDDAHYFGVHNVEKALGAVPRDAVAILLSHTPEVYRLAAHAGVSLLLCGHTHGGQICLPGGIPVMLDARIPRHLGRGAWRYHDMQGYTSPGAGSSVLGVRLNCPPEITVHVLQPEDAPLAQ